MKKLDFHPPSSYFINNPKAFQSGNLIPNKDLIKAFDFAYNMCFGTGFHRNHRTGGQVKRRKGELFSNTFQGKLAEIVLYNYLISENLQPTEIDYRIMGQKQWDDCDFVVKGKHISVKSATFFSNLLFLEQKDWNSQGHYLPNKDTASTSTYDYFVLIRIKPDIKNILKQNRCFYSDEVSEDLLKNPVFEEKWYYDMPGFITHSQLVDEVIGESQLLHQNAMLNGKTQMDASNYYIQTADMLKIEKLITILG